MFTNSEMILRSRQNIEEVVSYISLDWLTGEVRILQGETDDVHIIQYTNTNFPDKKLAHIEFSSGFLSIVDGRKKNTLIGFNFNNTALEIYLPKKKIHSLTINSVGCRLFIQAVDTTSSKLMLTSSHAIISSGNYDECELNVIGSQITSEDIKIRRLNLHSTASKVELSGEISEVYAKTTGKGTAIRSVVVPRVIQSISTGTNVTVTIPDNEGFVLKFKKVSGRFKSDFSLTSKGHIYTYKNGRNAYSVEVRGGQFYLRKNE